MGDGCLNSEHFEELGGILKGKLEEHFKNQELRQGETSETQIFYPWQMIRHKYHEGMIILNAGTKS